MRHIRKYWHTKPKILQSAAEELKDYSPILQQILYNRGYQSREAAQEFIEARPPEGTHPLAMLGVYEAAERILSAIQHKQPIIVYGDYDVDGVTATALLVSFLENFGADVYGYIPNRFDEGYGLNDEALSALKESGARLVITVDCGIRSVEESLHARAIGLDLIITDHHHPGSQMPEALAVINPKQDGDAYPEKNLAGVGLAYKLADGILAYLNQHGESTPTHTSADHFLDLVALGTVADLAPLVGENRSLVRSGLELIRRPQRQGLSSLIGAAGLNPNRIGAGDIGYILGPRLNAAGRLESAQISLNLLTTQDVAQAGEFAQQLEIYNRERQHITRDIQSRAEQIALTEDPEALLLFAAHADFNPGVVGLAASRLTDLYYRPSIVASRGPEFTRGSCRSIPEFHITQALDQCADLLTHYGGHAAAAGFTVANRHLDELVERLQTIAQEQLADIDLRPTLTADIEVPLYELRPDILKDLDRLQPTGYGNREAIFVSRGLRVIKYRPVGRDSTHLKLTVTDGTITYDAIAFQQGYWVDQMPQFIDLMYKFELNEFNGRSSLQLNVQDIQLAN